jgi:hypothetical protein
VGACRVGWVGSGRPAAQEASGPACPAAVRRAHFRPRSKLPPAASGLGLAQAATGGQAGSRAPPACLKCLRGAPCSPSPPMARPFHTRKQSAGDVTLRLCGFDVGTGLGAFMTLPMAKHVSGEAAARQPPGSRRAAAGQPPWSGHWRKAGRAPAAAGLAVRAAAPSVACCFWALESLPHIRPPHPPIRPVRPPGKRAQLGLRYSSPLMSAGAIVQPATNTLSNMWVVARHEDVTGAGAAAPSIGPLMAPHGPLMGPHVRPSWALTSAPHGPSRRPPQRPSPPSRQAAPMRRGLGQPGARDRAPYIKQAASTLPCKRCASCPGNSLGWRCA